MELGPLLVVFTSCFNTSRCFCSESGTRGFKAVTPLFSERYNDSTDVYISFDFTCIRHNLLKMKCYRCAHVCEAEYPCCSCVFVMVLLSGAVPCLISPNLAGSRVAVLAACLYGRHAGCGSLGLTLCLSG